MIDPGTEIYNRIIEAAEKEKSVNWAGIAKVVFGELEKEKEVEEWVY
jgi:hypothetical protein